MSNIVSGFELPDMILALKYRSISGPILTTDIADIDTKIHWLIRYWYREFKPWL